MRIPRRMPERTAKCERCKLRYKISFKQCPHCSELDDAGLKVLSIRIEEESIANAAIGRKMIIGAVLLVLAIIVLVAF